METISDPSVVCRTGSNTMHQIEPLRQPHDGEAEEQSERVDESEAARIERLGRARPAVFKSLWTEIGFCYSVLASQFMAVSSHDAS